MTQPKTITRRDLLRHSAAAAAFMSLPFPVLHAATSRPAGGVKERSAARIREFLHNSAYRKEAVDLFLDPKAKVWAKFDPELGYTLRSSFFRDGMGGCYTLQRYAETGERQRVNFPDLDCRINTYGDSFTQGAQVSDGETWQEVLAAHFCEPVRNFGIGGQGVYHAYRRMLRKEATDLAAPNIIINIWGDDHQRSINAWRWLTYHYLWAEASQDHLFHGNPWDHARLDAETGELLEIKQPFRKPEDLYKLTDKEFVYETFKDDPVVHILVGLQHPDAIDPEPIERMGAAVGITELDFSNPGAARNSAWWVYNAYAWKVSEKIMEKVKAFADKNGKNLLVLLSYPEPSVREICEGMSRDELAYLDWHPRSFREHLDKIGVRYVDTLPAHLADFNKSKLTPKEYTDKYYIGHYNPHGNHFFAYAIKDALVEWLDPKPPAYRGLEKDVLIRFKGYLPGS